MVIGIEDIYVTAKDVTSGCRHMERTWRTAFALWLLAVTPYVIREVRAMGQQPHSIEDIGYWRVSPGPVFSEPDRAIRLLISKHRARNQ